MAKNELGLRQTYKQTGHLGNGGGPGEKAIAEGSKPSGSLRANNAVKGKPARSSKVGPDKNLNELKGGNFY